MLNRTRTFFAMLMMAGAATMFVSVDSYAATNDPHQEENDGCDHGATGKECRDDPSEKGKDCEEHGKHGGVNEDHCSTTTTAGVGTVTTLTDVTVPTVPEVTVPTVPEVVVPGTDGPAPPPGEEAPRTAPPADGDLPTTGTSSEALTAFAGGLLLFGTGLRKLTRPIITK